MWAMRWRGAQTLVLGTEADFVDGIVCIMAVEG